MLFQAQGANVLAAEDPLGIVYLIQNSQQFWSELEDIVHIPSDKTPTLSLLDSALRRFISLSASYHEQYLQSPFQLEHACELLLNSELFVFHSERMSEILVDEAQSNTDPHFLLILYNILLYYGRRHAKFLRSPKRWQLLVPLLMDHVLVDVDINVEEMYLGGGSRVSLSFMIPIEAKLRSLGVKLLYEVCRVQKFSVQDLRMFNDPFIDHLFDLVEQTRGMQDETFNYSVIKLIVSLNEQFMVASIPPPSSAPPATDVATRLDSQNRVLHILMRRLGTSKTFGENMIFMLNRADRTSEDMCMQLLVLKILYLLFTTKGTSEYFYTNDLCVLVDVFLRELVDLDEDSESLRHTYLRVLNPLLTKTQLRDIPYKRAQIVVALESLMENAQIRDIDPTTKRLVERCLSGDWCVQYRKSKGEKGEARGDIERVASPGSDAIASAQQTISGPSTPISAHLERSASSKKKGLKMSKSVENLKAHLKPPRPPRSQLEALRVPNNGSASSLPGVNSATTSPPKWKEMPRSGGLGSSFSTQQPARNYHHSLSEDSYTHPHPVRADSLDASMNRLTLNHHAHPPRSPRSVPASTSVGHLGVKPEPASGTTLRRSAPPAPPKRRKPPAVPVEKTNGGATITVTKTTSL